MTLLNLNTSIIILNKLYLWVAILYNFTVSLWKLFEKNVRKDLKTLKLAWAKLVPNTNILCWNKEINQHSHVHMSAVK